jgi:predicted nucleic acid-binding protein
VALRNITLTLDENTLREARVLAAQRGLSVSAWPPPGSGGDSRSCQVKRPLSSTKARDIVEEYMTWTIVENTSALLREAMTLQQRAKLSFWDALVVQAAIGSGCERLYSEDLDEGQRFGGVVIVNPFAAL